MQKILVVLFSLWFSCSIFAQEKIDKISRIAIICAFQPEIPELKAALKNAKTHTIHRTQFITGKIGNKDVVLFLSGMSMVNAAMTTQMALDHFNVEKIVFSGVAGGINPNLSIGDVSIPEQWSQYQETVMAREVSKDHFEIPPFLNKTPYANFGMVFPQNVQIANGDKAPEEKFWFKVDENLMAQAKTILAKPNLNRCTAEEHCLSHPPKVVFGGNGVSGQSFMDNAAYREYVYSTFQANVVDMESASVGHVAYSNNVPFIVFRSLSDLAGGGEGANEETIFMELAAKNSSQLVTQFVKALK
ncbi:5'-methylthioadenosine/S-adenosylhomocysteine nucleosidase [Acinetobacter puyangensis]|uniref:Methylthioadenosine nucleosidase /adenosylhomocysteine nucleosidase n=1 Tax=Acinetobacter puyangensis TaxID=1096779 RepID=A0A240ECW2_9GAMM|nr:5'-methylthioadenosine/S-adenosylhomocysteine nucleosidase [Acinetobacter puyangensis]SNX46532.1 methylthioadenosine nucleosidase /adenosylhomocysteine nucleosidase [Acinetobacter puyangensis]